MRRANQTPARAGFTLIELLVVMMIIAILMSLVLSAVFSVRESQMKSFTETLIHKLSSALDQQWKAAVDQIRDEPVPNWALTMAGGNPQIAKVIYLKTRLKQEFPVSFFQAIYPNANFTPGATSAYQTSGGAFDLPPKPAYRKAIPISLYPNPATNAPPVSPIPQPDQGLPPEMQGFESSALLYLTLSQTRRGQAAFNPDDNVEPSAIRSATVGGVQFKYFVDSWGNPVRYWAFPFYNDELNGQPYLQNAPKTGNGSLTQNQQSPDPQDPDQVLLTLNSAAFQAMVHPPKHPASGSLRMLIPVVGSAGKDGLWGVDQFLMLPMADPPTASTEPALGYGLRSNDNIYSYRLRRSGQRGD